MPENIYKICVEKSTKFCGFPIIRQIWKQWRHKNKTKKFNSKYWYPGKFDVNAFTVSWSSEHNYLVPPIYLIPGVKAHIKRNSCKGVLVLPYWLSAAYWPLIATSKTNFSSLITDCRIFWQSSQCFSLGNNKKSSIGSSKNIRELSSLTSLVRVSGCLLTVDFEKTFDSLNHKFLIAVLKKIRVWWGFYWLDQNFIKRSRILRN